MDLKIITESQSPQLLELLHRGKFEEIIEKFDSSVRAGKGLSYFAKESEQASGTFASKMLYSCLRGELFPNNYATIEQLSFDDKYLDDIEELIRILHVLEDYGKENPYELLIALTILECLRSSAMHIADHTKESPRNSINARIWLDGAGLRVRTAELAEYFGRKNMHKEELGALLLRAHLTNLVLNHYPGHVGPDMIAVARQFEQLNQIEDAKPFYQAVVNDFTAFVDEIIEQIKDPAFELDKSPECFPITQSLIDGLEGMKSIGESIDENILIKAKNLMADLVKIRGH